jgi:hypothetical protein
MLGIVQANVALPVRSAATLTAPCAHQGSVEETWHHLARNIPFFAVTSLRILTMRAINVHREILVAPIYTQLMLFLLAVKQPGTHLVQESSPFPLKYRITI